jgi:hypothetical protein
MNSNNPFGLPPSIIDLHRQTRPALEAARSAFSHADNLKQLMDQMDGPLTAIRDLQTDPYRDTMSMMVMRMRDEDGWRSTARAIEDASKQRELTLQAVAGISAMQDRQRLALTAFDSGILRTAELLGRNGDTIASAIAAVRAQDEIAMLASSIVKRMEALRFTDLTRDTFPRTAVDEFLEQYARAQRAAAEFTEAETEEERTVLLATLLMALVNALRGLLQNTRKDVLGLSALALLGVIADVKTLLPSHPPTGMTVEQVAKLDETHRGVEQIEREFKELRESDRGLDDAYVATLPRAELKGSAIIRDAPRREGKALGRAAGGTPLAVSGAQGRWKMVVFRDPLTGQLAQGWVYNSNVTMLD